MTNTSYEEGLNRFAAQKIMGWTWVDGVTPTGVFIVDEPRSGWFISDDVPLRAGEDWDPCSNWGHAMELAEAMRPNQTYGNSCDFFEMHRFRVRGGNPEVWRWSVTFLGYERIVRDSGPLAVTVACARAYRSMGVEDAEEKTVAEAGDNALTRDHDMPWEEGPQGHYRSQEKLWSTCAFHQDGHHWSRSDIDWDGPPYLCGCGMVPPTELRDLTPNP